MGGNGGDQGNGEGGGGQRKWGGWVDGLWAGDWGGVVDEGMEIA